MMKNGRDVSVGDQCQSHRSQQGFLTKGFLLNKTNML